MSARINTVDHLNNIIVANLHRINAMPFDVIVHLPRSGTIPASLIATYLVRPFCSVEEFCRGYVNIRKAHYKSLHRILLVDDSIRTGVQMKNAVDRIKAERPDAEIQTLSVYSTLPSDDVRIFEADLTLHEHNDDFYIFPWFLWKTKRIKKVCVDMDGVLCRDCTKPEDDDGAEYKKFLAHAEPKFRSEFPIGWIVTGRLEKYRPETEKWLRRHDVSYKNLLMGPWSTRDERRANDVGLWKGKVFSRLNSPLFVESSDKESQAIHAASKKTVFCIDSQKVYGGF